MRRRLDDHQSLNATSHTSIQLSAPPGTPPTANHQSANLRSVSDTVNAYPRVVAPPQGTAVPSPVQGAGGVSAQSLTVPRPTSNTSNIPSAGGGGGGGGVGKPIQRQPLAIIQEPQATVPSESREMQGGVQYSVQVGYPARVAAGSLPQGSHGHSSPASVHHSHNLQTQAHQQQVMHQAQAHSQAHASQVQGQQHQQFQRLKVEDALSYLDQVKFKFGNQPKVYNDFLDIMKEFKSQSIDTPGVIQRVSNLFKGHPELIVGFNTFLPPGYKIEVQPNEQVNVSMPASAVNPSSGPSSSTLPSSNISAPVSLTPPVTVNNTQNNIIAQNSQSNSTSTPHLPSAVSNKQPGQPSTPSSQPHHASHSQHTYHQTSPVHSQSTTPAAVNNSASPQQASQPVEFNHAINYVNKIKNRFQGQPDIYKQFLEILHTYQKDQRNAKEGICNSTTPLTEAEVYAQVAKLFQNQVDLLQEFSQFLPDANGAAATLMSTSMYFQQTPKSVNNDHTAAVKKTTVTKPVTSTTNNQTKPTPPVKRPTPSLPLQPNKKFKMTSLKDVSLAEAGKYGTLNEFAFFDKARKALKSQEVYDNFLRCIVLYNQEILSRGELVHLVTPFLGKFPELFKWFKDFLGYKEMGNNAEAIPNKVAAQDRERIGGDLAMEIDYSSCKKYGASYRALPKNYVQPKCTGRTPLCKEVLNDTWVSFPSWSEDSTFVSSRKTQYEEYIYRCEDERFELDVVLEANLSTIRVLESVQKKLNRMPPEERSRYRLDDTLGGTSTVIHQRAIKRIYGDKAADIIEGLKKNPVVAVPLVLRRLKAKEEEWREAQKSFNKIWRDQNEKYYLKSLDHQGITFKQNDVKFLRSKSLLNDIETIFEERHEQAEEGSEVPAGPQLSFIYKDKSILDDAANLIIHHVKRQTGIHKEDKQKIKQLMWQFIPDYFSVPRGELSDDEMDKDDMEIDENSNPTGGQAADALAAEKEAEATANAGASALLKMSQGDHSSLNQEPLSDVTKNTKETLPNGDAKESETSSNNRDSKPMFYNSDPDDSYSLFFVNNNWYLFFRLHHILCERLTKIYERSVSLAAEEAKVKKDRKESTAVALRLKPKNEIDIEEYYPTFLDMVKNLLDGNMEANHYEDTLREMFGIHAYIAFTLDKVVQNAVRQLQHIVCDESCIHCTELYLKEQLNGATGGPCSTAVHRVPAEIAYQKKAEQILSDENCFKIMLYKKEGKLTIDLLDTDTDTSEDQVEVEKWNDYVSKYIGEDDITDELKEQLANKPVFLQRNIRVFRQQAKGQNIEDVEMETSDVQNAEPAAPENLDGGQEAKPQEGSASTNEALANSDATEQSKQPQPFSELLCRVKPDIVEDNTVCKFNVDSFKMVYVMPSESYFFKRMALKKARESHKRVSEKLNEKFHHWHAQWLQKYVTAEMQKASQDWFLCDDETSDRRTVCITENEPSKPPYATYNHYRLQREEKT